MHQGVAQVRMRPIIMVRPRVTNRVAICRIQYEILTKYNNYDYRSSSSVSQLQSYRWIDEMLELCTCDS